VGVKMSDNIKLTKGSIGEYQAIFQLLREGYNVYKNVESNGQIDIIIESRETKKLVRIDIKTAKVKLRKNQLNYPDEGILKLRIDEDGIMWVENYIKDMIHHQDHIKHTRKFRFKESMYKLGMSNEKPSWGKYENNR
jgi:Holliday junction resolvase-like predicted endonuclease|tara:strand:- start:64 stop:474 length:411 start_codon:yes stop_codon:yes gene_type:complete